MSVSNTSRTRKPLGHHDTFLNNDLETEGGRSLAYTFAVCRVCAVADGASETPAVHHGAGMSLFHSPGGASVRLPAPLTRHSSRPQARQSVHQRRDADQTRRLRACHEDRP